MATTRNSSIEMLRLFAIFGIVIMHVNGPLLSDAFGINSIWIQIENSIFNCGVSVFVLISGYFGIRRSSFKILLLELSALFYSLVASLLTLFVSGGGIRSSLKRCCRSLRMKSGSSPAIYQSCCFRRISMSL